MKTTVFGLLFVMCVSAAAFSACLLYRHSREVDGYEAGCAVRDCIFIAMEPNYPVFVERGAVSVVDRSGPRPAEEEIQDDTALIQAAMDAASNHPLYEIDHPAIEAGWTMMIDEAMAKWADDHSETIDPNGPDRIELYDVNDPQYGMIRISTATTFTPCTYFVIQINDTNDLKITWESGRLEIVGDPNLYSKAAETFLLYAMPGAAYGMVSADDAAIRRLCASGRVCAVKGHNWRDGRPGEGEGGSGYYLDYHPTTNYRTCRLCGKCETQELSWK